MGLEEDFYSLCTQKVYSDKDQDMFRNALLFAKQYLSSEKRLSGDSYLDYNLRVAMHLVENRSDSEVVTAGLLAYLLKFVDFEELKEQFGPRVVALLEEADQLTEIKGRNTQLQMEGLRRVLVASLKDIRVIVIKLAQKLENLKTIDVFPAKRQQSIAREVIEIYAPLAYRLGIDRLRVGLEDRAFAILNPRKYEEIQNYLEESREEREKSIEEAIALITKIVGSSVSLEKIKGRPKHIYSIYRKVRKKGVRLQDLFDLLGIRIIVPEIKDCYTLLGILHENFEPLEGRLKDYIANPKPNFYRSIHTGICLPNGKIAEIQIRTPEMDEFAEEGLAAHWRYKEMKSDQLFERKVAWMKGILDLQRTDEGKEFLESVKLDLFGDQIYCYTPHGDVKELPLGATLLDFAYSVHEEVGNTAIGGRVNGKFVPIKYQLSSGDVVEVLTNKKQRPRRSWIKIVSSAKSRQKIRKAIKEYDSSVPAFYFRKLKPVEAEEEGLLTYSPAYPKASCSLAKCCLALPGEDIIGIPTKRRVISVHGMECREAAKQEERWVEVAWKETFNQKIRFYVLAQERSGVLADLLHTIAQAGFNVKEANAKMAGDNIVECSFLVIPRDLNDLKEMVTRVRKVRGVKRMYFD